MKKTDFGLEVIREGNGYILTDAEGLRFVIQDDEQDELKSHEELLWHVVEYFAFGGCKHDEVRLRVVRERRDGSIIGEGGNTRFN